jgi:hypothetical protein
VRKKEQGSYLKCDGDWTSALSEARDFATCATAIEAVCAAKLKGTEIVLVFDEPGFEMIMSLNGMEQRARSEGQPRTRKRSSC